jgi:hypothetical protein
MHRSGSSPSSTALARSHRLLSEPTADTQPCRREPLFMPLSRHSGEPRTGRVGWQAALLPDFRARRG